MNHKENGENSQRISKVEPFIDKYNLERIIYPSGVADRKRFKKKKNPITVLNVLYIKHNKKFFLLTFQHAIPSNENK